MQSVILQFQRLNLLFQLASVLSAFPEQCSCALEILLQEAWLVECRDPVNKRLGLVHY